jgi:hypothetical protein
MAARLFWNIRSGFARSVEELLLRVHQKGRGGASAVDSLGCDDLAHTLSRATRGYWRVSWRASRRWEDRHHLHVPAAALSADQMPVLRHLDAEAVHSERRLAAGASIGNGLCGLATLHDRRIAGRYGFVIPPNFYLSLLRATFVESAHTSGVGFDFTKRRIERGEGPGAKAGHGFGRLTIGVNRKMFRRVFSDAAHRPPKQIDEAPVLTSGHRPHRHVHTALQVA